MAERSPARRRQAGPRRGNLPAEVSQFVGRRQELQQLLELQRANRLLTLVGPGGVGKTRIAVRLATERARAYPDGAWLVDIAPVIDPDLVPHAVATALLVANVDQPSQSVADITDALRERRILLVLDTCERHVAASAAVADRLVRDCRGVDIVATSRQPLGVSNELIRPVPPLALPGPHLTRVRQLRQSEACQLFMTRARAALPNFDLRDNNAVIAARICRMLDGLPLAVELVAAHVARLGLNDLAARISSSFVLSLAGTRGAPTRHQTLRASLDWSYDLLSDSEQLLIRRLAVFAAGWSPEVAADVCADGELEAASVAHLVASLCEKSLVIETGAGQQSRFQLANVTRQYGLDLLRTHGELDRFQRRHLEWVLALAEQAAPEAFDVEHARRLDNERDNLRAALEFALEHGEAEIGLRIATAAFPFWLFQNRLMEGKVWLDRLLVLPAGSVPPRVSAAARTFRAQLMLLQGKYLAAEADLQTLVIEQRERSDGAGLAVSLSVLGNAALWRGALDSARRAYRSALELLEEPNELGDIIAYQSARIAWETGDLEAARRFADRLLQIGVTRHKFTAFGRSKQIHALLVAEAGDTSSALRLLQEAESQQRHAGDNSGVIDTLIDRGHVLLAVNRREQAQATFAQAARLSDTAGTNSRLIRAIEGLSRVIVLSEPALAVQLASAAAASRAASHAQLWPRDKRLLEESLAVARLRLGAAAYAHAWQNGAVMLESEAVALALSAAGAQATPGAPRRPANITPREWEVVRLLVGGASNTQIAERLVISPATVRTHLDRIQAKLGLHSRVQLAAWAVESASLRYD